MKQPARIQSDSDPNAITIEEARSRITKSIQLDLDTEIIAIENAKGRICAVDVVSPMSVPSFRASAMDGYAVRVAECNSVLTVRGKSLAGHPGSDMLDVSSCQRITTGARVPDQADAVVQQENVTVVGDQIKINQAPTVGLHIREPGTDSKVGSPLIKSPCRIGAAEIALAAAHGISSIEVKRPLSVAIFSTGDELCTPGTSLNKGQIFDANRPLINALLASSAVNVIDLGICADSRQALEEIFARSENADLLISSGGVSVGEADHVRSVLESHGSVALWKIAMKPGRPLTFGFYREQQPYFGLPGNPVSAAITCLLFVKPAINHLLGLSEVLPPPMQLPLKGQLIKNPGRTEYQRAFMSISEEGFWYVATTGLQDSHVLSSLHLANCLIELPTDSMGASDGDLVQVYPFTHFAEPKL
ncbi:MAG: gephyrin-like molybdotransferase Glp [Granulosicoccus sp.]